MSEDKSFSILSDAVKVLPTRNLYMQRDSFYSRPKDRHFGGRGQMIRSISVGNWYLIAPKVIEAKSMSVELDLRT